MLEYVIESNRTLCNDFARANKVRWPRVRSWLSLLHLGPIPLGFSADPHNREVHSVHNPTCSPHVYRVSFGSCYNHNITAFYHRHSAPKVLNDIEIIARCCDSAKFRPSVAVRAGIDSSVFARMLPVSNHTEKQTMPDNAKDAKQGWPYTSFKTLLNLVLHMDELKAIPPKIDRSYLGGSEGQKTQVLNALKFLGLVTDGGDVTADLRNLVNGEKDRPKLMKALLEKCYPEANKLAAVHGTTAQLAETFTGLNGDTLRKAMTFYLHAAKYAGVPVSKNFKVPTGFSSRRSSRRNNGNASATQDTSANPGQRIQQPADAKARYLEMLMEKAKTATDEAEKDLFDRIERLLNVGDDEPAT